MKTSEARGDSCATKCCKLTNGVNLDGVQRVGGRTRDPKRLDRQVGKKLGLRPFGHCNAALATTWQQARTGAWRLQYGRCSAKARKRGRRADRRGSSHADAESAPSKARLDSPHETLLAGMDPSEERSATREVAHEPICGWHMTGISGIGTCLGHVSPCGRTRKQRLQLRRYRNHWNPTLKATPQANQHARSHRTIPLDGNEPLADGDDALHDRPCG